MAIADGHGLPIAVRVTSASPNESTLAEDTLRQRHIRTLPERMIGNRAYDSDRLDERLRQEHGVELIAPNRRRPKRTQDSQPLRRTCGVGRGLSGFAHWGGVQRGRFDGSGKSEMTPGSTPGTPPRKAASSTALGLDMSPGMGRILGGS
jgi:Transposase DDE domain